MIKYFFTGLYIIANIFAIIMGVMILTLFPVIIWVITENASWAWLYCIHFIALITCMGYEENSYE